MRNKDSIGYRIDDTGWLRDVRHCPSPNFNQRPPGQPVDLLVIHNISLPPGEFGGGLVEQLFCNDLDCTVHPALADLHDLHVSAHLLIDRSGQVTQFVSFNDRAWHAGQSCFDGRDNCNDFSIGIELEGTDTLPYASEQYSVLAAITRVLLAYFPSLRTDRIVGHCDIAPQRKTDPGPAFDWSHYRHLLEQAAISR